MFTTAVVMNYNFKENMYWHINTHKIYVINIHISLKINSNPPPLILALGFLFLTYFYIFKNFLHLCIASLQWNLMEWNLLSLLFATMDILVSWYVWCVYVCLSVCVCVMCVFEYFWVISVCCVVGWGQAYGVLVCICVMWHVVYVFCVRYAII